MSSCGVEDDLATEAVAVASARGLRWPDAHHQPATGNGFYRARSLPVSAQQCMNWYVSIPSAPSLSETHHTASRHVPGGLAARGEPWRPGDGWHPVFFVNGSNLYRLNSDHTLDDLGTISGAGRVSMSDNGTQLCILVPGAGVYIHRAFHAHCDFGPGFHPPTATPSRCHCRGRVFVFTTDAKKFISSAINDGTDYNAIDYGTAESSPDATVTPVVFKTSCSSSARPPPKPFPTSAVQISPFSARDCFG